MAQTAQSKKNIISVQEYLEMEKYAGHKSEYYYGEIFAMSGASHSHNVISMNVGASLHSLLRNSKCFVYASDMKIQIDEAGHFTYPDLSIVCGDIKFAFGRNDTIENPVVIFEILSESTMDYDRGSKFTAYRGIESLRDYILINQYNYHVEHFQRDESGQWRLDEFKDLKDRFMIISIGIELSLDTIYERVDELKIARL